MATRKTHGFSLIELLVVVAVIGMIASFAVSAVAGILKGNNLTTASNMLVDQLSLARQHALSRNRIVEVRFYRMADPEMPGEVVDDPDTGHYRGFQYFELGASGAVTPISKVLRFPDGIIMNPGETLSTLLGGEGRLRTVLPGMLTEADPELPRNVGHHYAYRAFRFLPDGTTSLSIGDAAPKGEEYRWFISVQALDDLAKTNGNTEPPPNFTTWILDPVNGTSNVFRPGLK